MSNETVKPMPATDATGTSEGQPIGSARPPVHGRVASQDGEAQGAELEVRAVRHRDDADGSDVVLGSLAQLLAAQIRLPRARAR
jgi:hypothetical protein